MIETLNPLSDFWKSGKDGTRLDEISALMYKNIQFCKDVYKEEAVDEHLKKITLGENGATKEMVDKVAGVWRIQRNFPYEITRVRDKDMVIMDRINYKDKTGFEYYNTKCVGYNCYGPFMTGGNTSDYIVSKSVTNKGVCWGYGKTIESARAFLGLKLLDEYMDVVKSVMNQNIRK